jgi:hypothetical protein
MLLTKNLIKFQRYCAEISAIQILKVILYSFVFDQKKQVFFPRILVNSRKNKARRFPRNYKILVEEFEIKACSN